MNAGYRPSRPLRLLALAAAFFLLAGTSHAQGAGDLSAQLSSLEGEIASATSSANAAKGVIDRLDNA
ncbi:MAG: hypothetical protein ACREQB_00110, partial [Candidatus Binataceae bacterium]